MNMDNKIYSPQYSASRALIVGINNYQYASPLGYAVRDAEETSQLLMDEFGFDERNISLLTDANAARARIIESFLSYVDETEIDDRIVFFFAGHGHTRLGHRGEVGYLVPYDGDTHTLSTLIRWDDLTRNAELIPAKHILFVMDACYGGLAITRSLLPGSMRFLKDMLLRYSRQVITAGKADEVVSDSGGPLPGHSIFTGHLIEALRGNAASEDGVITANGIMAYVYERVSRDQHSHQTPHYGFVEGDGDFIFKAPILELPMKEEEKDEDILITVPSTMPMMHTEETGDIINLTKEYLSDPRYTIKLNDLVIQKLRETLLLTSEDNFAVQGTDWSLDEFTRRLKEYEQAIEEVQRISCYLAYWGKREHLPILRTALTRLTDRLESNSGQRIWLALRWYPMILLLYSAGISALAADNYENLSAMLLTRVGSSRFQEISTELTLSIGGAILDLERENAFKQLPGHERHYTPRSEYLFKLLQPMLDDLLFLGRDYEKYFDRFEVLLALVHADLEQVERSHIWGPVGRFGWKFKNPDVNPLKDIMDEAERQKDSWGPLNAGLFGGDYSRFKNISDEYVKRISDLPWH
jgi:hypothetical protein